MNKFLKISRILLEVEIDSLKNEPDHIQKYIRVLQGRVKSYSGADLSGFESIRDLKRIRQEHPKEWDEMMNDQLYVDKPWISF